MMKGRYFERTTQQESGEKEKKRKRMRKQRMEG